VVDSRREIRQTQLKPNTPIHFPIGLRGVKRELLNALQQCRSTECKNVQKDYEIGRLDENNIHYDSVSLSGLQCFNHPLDS
jgi:hypothetical protein